MPTALYIVIPVLCGLVAAAGIWLGSRNEDARPIHDLVTLFSSISAGLGAFFTAAVLLLSFVPGPGTYGPVQYWGGSDEAMGLFHFRIDLFKVGIAVMFAALIQGTMSIIALFSRNNRLAICAWTATALCGGGFIAGLATLTKWMPTV